MYKQTTAELTSVDNAWMQSSRHSTTIMNTNAITHILKYVCMHLQQWGLQILYFHMMKVKYTTLK
jgi:hypothetical protein